MKKKKMRKVVESLSRGLNVSEARRVTLSRDYATLCERRREVGLLLEEKSRDIEGLQKQYNELEQRFTTLSNEHDALSQKYEGVNAAMERMRNARDNTNLDLRRNLELKRQECEELKQQLAAQERKNGVLTVQQAEEQESSPARIALETRCSLPFGNTPNIPEFWEGR